MPTISSITDTVLNFPYEIPDGIHKWWVTAIDMAGFTINSDTFQFYKNGAINTIWGYVEYDNNFKENKVNKSIINID